TQRRHMEYLHAGVYRKWAKENNFESMLPRDSKARRDAEREHLSQTLVEDHYTVQKPEDKPVLYSNELFKEAAIQWLVEMDQVLPHFRSLYFFFLTYIAHDSLFNLIQAFEHPTYQKMIQIAARATKQVQIPNRKQTREAIIAKFKEQMKALRDRFNVCSVSSLLYYLINL
ncbi:hypothetical protein BYT27DRAFT_7305410, partial [Phlegmacium glaucopus]